MYLLKAQGITSIPKVTSPLYSFFYYDKYYNYGDNPVFKKFLKIAMHNMYDGQYIDHRTHYIPNGQKLFLSRNFDDVLQRDLKCYTFPRAFAIFIINSMVFLSAWKFTKLMLPVGKFGIKKISQTPLYNNFGMLGVTGVVSILVLASYTEWRTLRFTLDKFYRHIILQQRNWLQINAEHSIYCNYEYKDSPLSNYAILESSETMKVLKKLYEVNYKLKISKANKL